MLIAIQLPGTTQPTLAYQEPHPKVFSRLSHRSLPLDGQLSSLAQGLCESAGWADFVPNSAKLHRTSLTVARGFRAVEMLPTTVLFSSSQLVLDSTPLSMSLSTSPLALMVSPFLLLRQLYQTRSTGAPPGYVVEPSRAR